MKILNKVLRKLNYLSHYFNTNSQYKIGTDGDSLPKPYYWLLDNKLNIEIPYTDCGSWEIWGSHEEDISMLIRDDFKIEIEQQVTRTAKGIRKI